jgi:hypothetical protein
MTDFRDPNTRLDMDRRLDVDARADMKSSNTMWGWIAGAVFLVLVLAVIFGLGGSDERAATNTGSPPAATTGAAGNPPATTPARPNMPAPASPNR